MAVVTIAIYQPNLLRQAATSLTHLRKNLHVAVGSIHADPLPIADQPRGMLHPHDGRQTVLARDHRAMGHQAPHFRDQTLDAQEQRRPARIRESRDKDVPWFEIGLRDIEYDAG